jgi:hypothetical protein
VRGAFELRHVIDVVVTECHVEVATHHDGLRGVTLSEFRTKIAEPPEFVGVVGIVETAPIGHITRVHPNTAAGRANAASLLISPEPRDHVVETDSGKNSDTVPLALAVVS